jgi:predicted AlkP superfamily pyrophosphatase or phosphodiesterase
MEAHMRSDRQGTVIASVWTPRTATGKQRVPQKPVLIATLISLVAWFALGACAPTASGPGTQGKAGAISPSWSPSASRIQDDAWHFAYAVQSWAAEQSGHVVMIPARYTIVVDRAFFSDEFSHIPLRALRGVRADDQNQVIVLKHLWTTHASSWDYDTDIKFVLYGPGFVKEGVRLEKTTLQNVAPTYARLIGTNAPKGSMGRVMTEALVPTSKKPKVIFTIVMDGGGRSLYDAWPDAWPVIKGLAARGVEYMDAKVTQLETATAVSHVAIGTGGYPLTTRIVGNEIYDPAKKQVTQSFPDYSPQFIMAPTLADEYGVSAGHKPVVIGTSFQDRAAMGMVGHGAAHHPGNKNHIVVLYAQPKKPAWKEQFPGGDEEHRLMTNVDLYTFPAYLRGRSPMPYVKELTGGSGVWMTHKIDDSSNVRFTPAYVEFECDNMLMMMDREPIDRDDVTALVYMSMKPTDYAAHRWGLESLEAREALRAQDGCVGKLIQKLNARVGEGNYVVTITADHGMMPMPEVTGGHRLSLRALLEMIDKKFGGKIGLGGGFINLWFDQAKMKELGITNHDVAAFLRSLTAGDYYGPREKWPAYLTYRPDERLFFNAYTFEQVEAFVKANPNRWMANPYAGAGTAVTLEHDLQQLHATGPGISYLAYGAHGDGQLPRIEDTGYFFRDGLELTEEHEIFEELTRR